MIGNLEGVLIKKHVGEVFGVGSAASRKDKIGQDGQKVAPWRRIRKGSGQKGLGSDDVWPKSAPAVTIAR